MSNKEKFWFEKEIGPEKDIRVFFLKLLKDCLKMKSGTGIFPEDMNIKFICNDKRPFINAFNKNKKNNNVFTPKIIADFLELVLRTKTYKKVIQIIKESDYKEAYNFKNQNDGLLSTCEDISEENSNQNKYGKCITNIIAGNEFQEKCSDCPVKRIMDALLEIQNNYYNYKFKDNIMQDYSKKEDKLLVEEIYTDIQNFECQFSSISDSEDTSFLSKNVAELFNSCIRCFEIENVADEKLSYIKWYTAHLCTWPYFKSCLIKINRYDEKMIYKLIESSSKINKTLCPEISWAYKVEIEKIVSYISLAYQDPFLFESCEIFDEIITDCHRILTSNIKDFDKLKLYIELWNLSIRVHNDYYVEKYETAINNILSLTSYSSGTMINIRYWLYQYINNSCNTEKMATKLINSFSEISKEERQRNQFDDNLDILTDIFIKISRERNQLSIGSEFPIDYLRVKQIRGTMDSKNTFSHTITKPSFYLRVFGDIFL